MDRRSFLVSTGAAIAVPNVVLAQTTTVRFLSVPVESYALVYYARDGGFFAKHGIDAQIQSTFSGATIAQAVIAGAVEVGCASIGPMSNAFLRGIPVRVIAGGGTYTSAAPTSAVAVAKSSPIASAKDLNGKIIGTSALKDLQQVSVVKWIDKNGGDSKTTKTVELGLADAVPAIVQGRIDAYPVVEPFLTNSRDTVKVIGYPYDAIGKRVALGIHVAHLDWIGKNRSTAERVVAALREAALWANANRDKSGAILEQIAHMPAATIAKMNHVVYSDTIERDAIQPEIDALVEYEYLPKRYTVDQIAWGPQFS